MITRAEHSEEILRAASSGITTSANYLSVGGGVGVGERGWGWKWVG